MPETTETRRVSAAPETLTIEWAAGGVSEFSSLWLLDNRAEGRDAHSGQRLIDIADLPERPRIRSALARDGVVRIEWEGQAPAASFELTWLAAHAHNRGAPAPETRRRRWLEGAKLDPRRDFAWSTPAQLRASRARRLVRPHSSVMDVSPDGRWFMFTSNRGFGSEPQPHALDFATLEQRLHAPGNGLRDIYVVDARVLRTTAAAHSAMRTTDRSGPGSSP